MKLIIFLLFLVVLASCNVLDGETKLEDEFFETKPNGVYLTYSGFNFTEFSAGSFSGFITISIYGDTFTGVDATTMNPIFYNVANLPAGLAVDMYQLNNQEMRFSLTGSATTHDPANSINNLTISFFNTFFTHSEPSEVDRSTKTFSITFI